MTGKGSAKTTVLWTQHALRDLSEIRAYIRRFDPVAAQGWLGRLKRRADTAAIAPLAGRVVPETGRDDIREVFLRSYRIVYRPIEGGLLVLTVFEGHRRFPLEAIDDPEP